MQAYTIKARRSVQRALQRWHEANRLDAPWRRSRDPYQCLVAAVMAQQTQMSRVLPSYERFVAAFPTLDDLAAATPGRVIRVWEGMGYNQRAVRLHSAAQVIAATGWPRDAASLERIDGIGPFTAAIIASFAFGQPAGCVDTNVRRVLGRLAGDEQMPAAALQRLADAMVPVDAPAEWNQAVMDYGASVCVPRPRCGECVVSRWCSSREAFASAAIADTRARYRTRPAQPAYEGSLRWYRGRIIDVLRSVPPGRTITVAALTRRIACDAAIDEQAVETLLAQLERDRLVVRRGRLVSLPD